MHQSNKPMLHVLSARPGLIRGGVAHPGHAAHALDRFTATQLNEMVAEPAIAVVVGRRLLPDDIADLLGAVQGNKTTVAGIGDNTDQGASRATPVVAEIEDVKNDLKREEHAAALAREVDAAEARNLAGGTAGELRAGAQANALDLASVAGAGIPAATTSADDPPALEAKVLRRHSRT